MPAVAPRVFSTVRGAPAFSLIELIIVILIASLFAALVFSNIQFGGTQKPRVGIRQLKQAVLSAVSSNADLVCVDKCAQCSVITGKKKTSVQSKLAPLKAYILDEGSDPQQIDFGRMDDKKVCLRFHYYPNGSTSQMILESEEKFYFIPSYFGKIAVFESLDGAVEQWRKHRDQLDTMGTYY